MHRQSIWLLLLVASLAQAEVRIESVTLYRDAGGEPGAEVASFELTDLKQHFLIRLSELKLGQHQFQVRFLAKETTQGDNVEVAKVDLEALIANQISTHVELPREWPLGRYQLEVRMDGKAIGRHDYIISPPWSEQSVGAWTLYGDDGAENATAEVLESFPSTQRTLHFEAQTNGYIARNIELRWRLGTAEGEEIVVIPQAIDSAAEVFNTVTAKVSLPQDWPPGSYVISLSEGERELGQKSFQVVDVSPREGRE